MSLHPWCSTIFSITYHATVMPYPFFAFLTGYEIKPAGIVICGSQVCNVLHNDYAGITYDLIVVTACFSGVRVFHHLGFGRAKQLRSREHSHGRAVSAHGDAVLFHGAVESLRIEFQYLLNCLE